ncbi:hypothetical protein [Glycomyces dulcitolivorans]|nr:hypothetical protein [Glycomyces dulcitolivorans]
MSTETHRNADIEKPAANVARKLTIRKLDKIETTGACSNLSR